MRFDFIHFKALTDEELSRIECIVNENIKKGITVNIKELGFDEAKKEGAIALFGEKYGDKVRMVSVSSYSKELCGGTHVDNTKKIKVFKIVSESSIASGVRRIEAVTGSEAIEELKKREDLIKEIANELKTAPNNIAKEIDSQNSRLKKLEKELDAVSQKFVQLAVESLLGNVKKIKDKDVIVGEITNVDMNLLRKASDAIKGRLEKPLLVLVSSKEGKLSMIVSISKSIKEKIDAVKLLNDIGSDFGVRGGGRPEFAQAGGRSGPEVKEILKKAEVLIKNIVG